MRDEVGTSFQQRGITLGWNDWLVGQVVVATREVRSSTADSNTRSRGVNTDQHRLTDIRRVRDVVRGDVGRRTADIARSLHHCLKYLKAFSDGNRTTVRLPTIGDGLCQLGRQFLGSVGDDSFVLGVGHSLNLTIE
ncbi:hypothetical protein D9M71_788990 [compost metagenome]